MRDPTASWYSYRSAAASSGFRFRRFDVAFGSMGVVRGRESSIPKRWSTDSSYPGWLGWMNREVRELECSTVERQRYAELECSTVERQRYSGCTELKQSTVERRRYRFLNLGPQLYQLLGTKIYRLPRLETPPTTGTPSLSIKKTQWISITGITPLPRGLTQDRPGSQDSSNRTLGRPGQRLAQERDR